ncbi:MAG TPA: hypothetical protein VFJ18_08390 [Pararhizobium sp.]|nr:hypothetical protein [Pararhizobium sp.]
MSRRACLSFADAAGSPWGKVFMRFLFRFLSFIALVAAVIAGTIDAIRSVAAGQVSLTSFSAAWAEVSARSLGHLETLIAADVPSPGNEIFTWLIAQPAFAVLLCLSFVLYCIGFRRRRSMKRLAWR